MKTSDKILRSLGRFKSARAALKFVEKLYQAGADKVVVPDIYQNKTDNEFADNLLVRLPKTRMKRAGIRKLCEQLKSRRLGAIEPERDIGEEYLVISMA